jgi:hypothetical protein
MTRFPIKDFRNDCAGFGVYALIDFLLRTLKDDYNCLVFR